MRGLQCALTAAALNIVALPAMAGGDATDPTASLAVDADPMAFSIARFIPYAQWWCDSGDATGCEIAQTLAPLPAALAAAAELCLEGDEKSCLEAEGIRRSFWHSYGSLSIQPDMLPGPDGEPPARPYWDQPAPDATTYHCDAFTPECGYFGDMRNIP